MENKINLYLLTGFLGSGKTTFLTNVLNNLSEEKIGVIMNEFGKMGIDGQIIKKEGMELIEINKGSIFCSCLKLSFAHAMVEMSKGSLKYLFVESSGLADPSNIGDVLSGVEVEVGNVYDYKGAICLVDALHFLDQIEDLETVERQLKHCHLVVINKIDLVNEETLSQIKNKIIDINSKVEIQECSFGELSYDFLSHDLMKNQWTEDEETTNTPESKPKSLNLTFNGQVTKEELTEFLNSVSESSYRIKGFFKLEDGWNQVDVVNRKIDYKLLTLGEAESPLGESESKLVFISKIGPNIIKPIIDNWKTIIGQEMKLR
ncbi:GTP-binding protein [Clostridium sp. FP2]|uniref:CobW family GTP-binding protein n=1 Tax=Clostridium sp. FP2 TaxID=2724481 RepID=UPI0013E97029|nr:CobW family GTP-binding protein [Clostridium sp. FP2]MBZ9625036.1 GTP-binding protein [Clostridium sp. FP2]